ncbi:hypothetical protein Tco_0411027 [Tanacetum coccineum]
MSCYIDTLMDTFFGHEELNERHVRVSLAITRAPRTELGCTFGKKRLIMFIVLSATSLEMQGAPPSDKGYTTTQASGVYVVPVTLGFGFTHSITTATYDGEDEYIPVTVVISGMRDSGGVTHAMVKKKGKAKDECYGKLILDLGNEVRSIVEQGTAAMEKLVEMLGNAKEKAECKKLKKELEKARGFMFEEIPNEAIDVPIKDEKSPSSEPRGFPRDS